MARYTHFYAVVPRLCRFDELYKVFITPTGLAIAFIGDQRSDDRFVGDVWKHHWTVQLFAPWMSRCKNRRFSLEASYDAMDVESEEFLSVHDRNRLMYRDEVKHARIEAKSHIWSPAFGRIQFVTAHGTRTLWVLKDQGLNSIHAELLQTFPAIEFVESCPNLDQGCSTKLLPWFALGIATIFVGFAFMLIFDTTLALQDRITAGIAALFVCIGALLGIDNYRTRGKGPLTLDRDKQ